MAISDYYLSSSTNDNLNLGDEAVKVALQNFNLQYTTFLYFNTTFFYGVELFLRVFGHKVVVNRGHFRPTLTRKLSQFVIFGSDTSEVEQFFNVIKEYEMDNTGKFIIICQSTDVLDCDERTLTRMLWDYKVVNVVIIKTETSKAVCYTYYPIADDVCNNTSPVKLEKGRYVRTSFGAVFEMKFKNLHLCPLIGSTFIQTPYMNLVFGKPVGADGDLLRMIAEGLNTSLEMMTPHRGDGWGWREPNGTWMGSLADVDEEIANFSMTSGAVTLTRFSDFQMSLNYYTSNVVWVSHVAPVQNEALKLMHPFRAYSRIALIVSFLIVVICAFFVKSWFWTYMCRTSNADTPSKSVVFYAWMVCMGQSLIKMPTKSSFLQMTMLWVWYCFLIRTAYQVYLISSLKGKFYEKDFETIEDVINAEYLFGGGPALKDYYSEYPSVYDNWVNIDTADIIPTVLNISQGMKFVIAMNSDTAKMVIRKHAASLHILPQKVVTSPTVIFFKKFSPLVESFNVMLSRLISSGFPSKLHQIYTSVKKIDHGGEEGETLQIVHFTACYLILISGWVVSFIFFIVEFYFGRYYQHPTEDL